MKLLTLRVWVVTKILDFFFLYVLDFITILFIFDGLVRYTNTCLNGKLTDDNRRNERYIPTCFAEYTRTSAASISNLSTSSSCHANMSIRRNALYENHLPWRRKYENYFDISVSSVYTVEKIPHSETPASYLDTVIVSIFEAKYIGILLPYLWLPTLRWDYIIYDR